MSFSNNFDNHNTILVYQNGIAIYPYIKGQCPELENICSYYDNVYHKRNFTTGFPIEKDCCFLSHYVSLSKLKAWFPNYKVIRMHPFRRSNMESRLKDTVKLRDNQVDIMTRLIGNKSREVFLNVPTAFGKTFLGVSFSLHLRTKTLVVCKSLKILQQWEKTIDKISTAGSSRVLHLSGSDVIKKLINGKLRYDDYDFFLATPATISSFAKSNSWYEFSSLIDDIGIGLKIIDEAHLNLGSTVKLNATTNIAHTLYLSADATRGNLNASRAFTDVFYNVPMLRLNDDEINKLRHIIATFVTYDSNPKAGDLMQIQGGKYNWSHTEYAKYQWNKGLTTMYICRIIDQILHANPDGVHYKILILLYTIDHTDSLTSYLAERYKDIFTVGRFHSKVDDDEKEATLLSDVIVSIYGSFGIGVDVVDPEIRYVISTVPIDMVNTNQVAGRCRPIEGLNSFVWMLYDIGFTYCQAKMNRVANYLKGSKVKDMFVLKMDDKEVE